MTEWGLRTRTVVSDYFIVFVAVAVVAAVLGGWLIYSTHVDPGVETQQEVRDSWQSTAEYDHSATVTESNRVFPVGSTLEDRSTYYTSVSPELDGTFRYGFGSNDGQLDVQAQSQLVIRSVGEGDGGGAGEGQTGGEVFWSVEEPLANETATVAPGDELTVPFTVNASAVLEEIEAVEEDLGASPGETEVLIRTDVTAEGTAAGGPAEHTAQYDLTLTPGADTYGVTAGGGTESHDRVESVQREVQYGLLRSALGPLLLVIGLVGLVGLGIARTEEWLAVGDRERTAMEFAAEREEFDDWISRGSVPDAAANGPTVEIESLEDLVDVAVDADARVVENVDDGVYYVLDGGNWYQYAPPPNVRR